MHAARLVQVALGPTLTLELELAADQSFRFAAGQYTSIALGNGKALTLSIASSPTRLPRLRFLYRPTPGDESAEAFSSLLRTEHHLDVAPAAGQVLWDPVDPRPGLLICAGTGLAQAFALCEQLADDHPEQLEHLTLLSLAASAADQIHHRELADWCQQGLKLKQVNDPTLGPENAGLRWLATEAAALAAEGARILIGGGPPFVYAVHDVLLAGGVSADQLQADVYEYAPR